MPKCDGCLWQDQCHTDGHCDYYTPLDEDEFVDQMIENDRIAFRAEWIKYIAEE